MRIRGTTRTEKITLNMTSMIDIVFLLLVFFIMTFRIVSQEGDFNIKMPLASIEQGLPDEQELLPLRLRLIANDQGALSAIQLNDQPFTSFVELNNYVIGYVGTDSGPGSERETAEIELDCDFNLHYEHVIEAITAVSGYVDDSTGQIVRLIEKIKFSPPEEPPN